MALAKLEIKIILTHLLHVYRWEILAGQSLAPVRVKNAESD